MEIKNILEGAVFPSSASLMDVSKPIEGGIEPVETPQEIAPLNETEKGTMLDAQA